tara:strand:- start:222 stop:752 length:531 start_codon:yes stop_codon:yes gene_type:complete
MIRNFFKKSSLRIAERELEAYVKKVAIGDIEMRGMILGHACLILSQLIKKVPVLEKIIGTEGGVFEKELSYLVLQTNDLLKEYCRSEDMRNASGVKLWNETFRCLSHPELTSLGKEMWSYFVVAQENAKEYLDALDIKFVEQGDDSMLRKIREAKNFIPLVPARYKGATEGGKALV